jgi:hypothetical protein
VPTVFCSACGQPIDAYQPYCPRCGRQVIPIPTATPPPWAWTRVHRHVHTLGLLWIAYAVLTLLSWMVAVGVLSGFSHERGFPFGHGFDGFYSFPMSHFPWLLPIITVVLAGRAVLCAVTGVALLRRASWARVLAIVTAFLTLIRPILGTALSVYTLWVLLPGASGQEYDQIATPSLQ